MILNIHESIVNKNIDVLYYVQQKNASTFTYLYLYRHQSLVNLLFYHSILFLLYEICGFQDTRTTNPHTAFPYTSHVQTSNPLLFHRYTVL